MARFLVRPRSRPQPRSTQWVRAHPSCSANVLVHAHRDSSSAVQIPVHTRCQNSLMQPQPVPEYVRQGPWAASFEAGPWHRSRSWYAHLPNVVPCTDPFLETGFSWFNLPRSIVLTQILRMIAWNSHSHLHKVLQHHPPDFLTLLRVKLRRHDIVPPDRGTERRRI